MGSALGKKIKDRRTQLRMTQNELAAKVGKTGATINKYEIGTVVNIPRPIIEKLADALEVSPGYLMGWTDESGKPLTDSEIIDSVAPSAQIIRAGNTDISVVELFRGVGGMPRARQVPADLSDEEQELLRIFRSLRVKSRTKLLSLAYAAEEEESKK